MSGSIYDARSKQNAKSHELSLHFVQQTLCKYSRFHIPYNLTVITPVYVYDTRIYRGVSQIHCIPIVFWKNEVKRPKLTLSHNALPSIL